jgi:CHAT domain-containing protein
VSFGATATLVRELEALALDHERRPPQADRADLLARLRVVRDEAEILNLPSLAAVAGLREGELLLAGGEHRAALAVLTDTAPQLSDDLRAVALARSSEALLALGLSRETLDVCARGIELVERDRDKTSAAYMQGAYLRRTVSLYANGVRAAHDLGDSRALTWMELSKGRTLPPMRDGHVPAAMRERFAELGERIDNCRDAEAETALRLKRRALFDRMLGAQRGAREPFDLAAVQAALAPGQRALSYYWLDPAALLVAVVTPDEVITDVRAVPDVEALAAAMVRGGEVEYHVATTLLDRVLEPLADALLPDAVRGAERLLVSPHRLLHTVPFLALPLDGRPLVRSMAVATIPNLNCLQAAPPAPASQRMLAVGVNEYATARTLRLAEEAARETAELYSASGYEAAALLGPAATEAALRDALDTPPAALHLTLHGASVESDTPLESWLLLGGSRLDGLDVIDWRLAGTTVVLASCSSGQRALGGRGMRELPGDDVLGLQAAFFCAGARQLLSALWPVEFRVARAITRGFHEQLIAGAPADIALRAAVVDYLDNARVLDRDTTYWAPFTLICAGRIT